VSYRPLDELCKEIPDAGSRNALLENSASTCLSLVLPRYITFPQTLGTRPSSRLRHLHFYAHSPGQTFFSRYWKRPLKAFRAHWRVPDRL